MAEREELKREIRKLEERMIDRSERGIEKREGKERGKQREEWRDREKIQ